MPALKPDIIYSGDNGRMFCGELRCAGMSAHFNGFGISGMKVVPITQRDVAELKAEGFDAECESCGKKHALTRAQNESRFRYF